MQEGLDRSFPAVKIPKHAKIAFSGVLWDVYHWDQKMFDGSVETFEGLRRKRFGVKVIALSNDKIIMTKEQQPGGEIYHTLLGGHLESGETPLEGAKRELLEEGGLVSEDWELFEIIDILNFPRIEFYIYLFIARNCKNITTQNLDKGEKISLLEVNFAEFCDKLSNNKERFGSYAYQIGTNEWRRKLANALKLGDPNAV